MLRTYPPGVPCWVQLDTPDTAAAAEFYGALFGWTFAPADPAEPESYLFARLDGEDVGALQRGGHDGWVSFIATDDIEGTCAAVERAGGAVTAPPGPGSPFGRSAACTDPQGAVFRLWQAGTHPGSQVVNAPGSWNFSDLHTPDPTASLAFYGTVFGWQVAPDLGAGMIRLPGYGDHLAATVDPDIRERQAFAPQDFADVIAGIDTDDHAEWSIRFAVADRDAAVAAVQRSGGSVEAERANEWVKDAVVRDPQGFRFVVSQFAPQV